MSDLSDERVREIAQGLNAVMLPTDAEVAALAREVLALRERVAEMTAYHAEVKASWVVADAKMRETQEQVATLTRQRDEAVAVAREAVEEMDGVGGVLSHQSFLDRGGLLASTIGLIGRTSAALRARLAAITGGSDADS